ncbi:uncharacterized protein LOC113383442 [Ctenocephalides felis]|uniref:uncharacterized protein LOC113383442 n=1 Tax=Ctenocephalides felis TaxID=7515 RepID=UPI000E6E1FFF|nr:uncharacterized protein LOC113383442 [Ctenocephalides felis]
MQNSRSNANSSKYGIENADSYLPMGLYTSGYGGNYYALVEKSNTKSKANKSKKSAEADESHKETINIHKQIKEANKLNRVTQKYLEYAAENRPHDIIVDLLSNKKDVIDLINNSLSRDDIVTGINILGKICSSSFTELKTKLISGTNDLFLHNLHDAMNSSKIPKSLSISFCSRPLYN